MSEQLVKHYFQQALSHDRLAHAYLLWGPDGGGRDAAAQNIATGLVCPEAPNNGGDPCGVCKTCHEVGVGTYAGFLTVTSEKAVLEIDAIRRLAGALAIAFEKRRVVFVPKLDKLTLPAANAFLKILEEPGGQTVYVLTTGNMAKLLPTIISRCHRLPLFLPKDRDEAPALPELDRLLGDPHLLARENPKNLLKFFAQAGKVREQMHALFSYIITHLEAALAASCLQDRPHAPPFDALPAAALLPLIDKVLALSEDIAFNINTDLVLSVLTSDLISAWRSQ